MSDLISSASSTTSSGSAAIRGRAGIALLTLQLRAAQQEAAQAEVAAAAADQAVARIQLRNQVDPMVVERTRALDEALVRAREEAAAMVAAAHRQAAMIVAWFDSATDRPPGVATEPALLMDACAGTPEAALHAELLDLQRQVAEIEAQIIAEPDRIRAAASAQAQSILAEARRAIATGAGDTDAE